MDSQFFQFQSYSVGYRIYGEGQKTIVLVHGFGEDGTVWEHQIKVLEEKYVVVVPDLPGSGVSAVNLQEEDPSIEESLSNLSFYANMLNALLEHLEIENCIVFGHSMGGYITLDFVRHFSEKVLGFGLIHSNAFEDSEEKKEGRKKGIALLNTYSAQQFLKNTIPNLFTDGSKKQYPEKVAGLIEKSASFKPKMLQYYYKAMMLRNDNSDVLKNAKVPVLMVAGKQDIVVSIADVLKQAHIATETHLHILESSAHMGMWEETTKVNAAMLDFVETIK